MKRSIGAATLAVALAGGQTAWAQAIQNVVLRNSFNPTGAGARGLGMGGAFIAVADDGTAASFNPAGLAQLRRTEFAVVLFTDKLTSTLTFPRGGEVVTLTDEARHTRLDFVGLAVPFDVGGRNLNVQFSYQRAVDLFGRGRATIQDTIDLSDIDPDFQGFGDFTADITPEQSGAFNTVSLSTGYQMTSRVALGLAINYWFADWSVTGESAFRLRVRIPGGPSLEVPLTTTQFQQDQSFTGFSLNAGFLLKYSWLSLGGVIRLPFASDYKLDENDTVTRYDIGRPLPPEERAFRVTSPLHWPRSLGGGIALRPIKNLTLAADYTYSQWSRTVIDNVPGGALLTPIETSPVTGEAVDTFTDRNFFDLLPASETVTQDTSHWRAGGEYLLVFSKLVIPLRGGVYRDRSPIAELGTDEGRQIKGWTAGTGLNFSHFVLDVAFERRESSGRLGLRLRQGQPIQAGTTVSTEDVRQDRIVASLIYRFGGAEDPLKKLFRSMFVGPKEKEDN
jgi:long-subunit fatty acid transport protein